MFSACASEVACGTTRFTAAASTRWSGPNSTAPNGPPLRSCRLRSDSSIASATLSWSLANTASGSNASWIQAGKVRWISLRSMAWCSARRPGVAQGDAAVEHRRVGAVVMAVGDEVAGALELERLLGRRQRRGRLDPALDDPLDRKSTRLNSSHVKISYAVFC